MAWSSFTSYMNGLFQSPAANSWGTLIAEPFNPSDRMVDLTAAIFRKYSEDGTGLTPQAFNRIRKECSLEALDAGAEELPPKALRDLATNYYIGRNCEYKMRLENDGSSLPLLTYLGFTYWLCYQLLIAPEATLKSLNKLLADVEPPLKDPNLDKPFTYTTIPSECLPKVQQSTIDNIGKIYETWNARRTAIIDQYKAEARRTEPRSQSAQKAVEVAKDELDTSGTPKMSAAERLQALTKLDSQKYPQTTSTQLNQQQQYLLAQQQQMAMYQEFALQQQNRAAQFAIQRRLQQAQNASMQNAADSMLASQIIQNQALANGLATQSWGIF